MSTCGRGQHSPWAAHYRGGASRMPVRIEALAMSPWATPVARLAGVPVVVAVRYFAAIAATGVVGEAGGTNSGVAEWFLESVGDSLGLVCLDRVAEPVPARDSLEQQVP